MTEEPKKRTLDAEPAVANDAKRPCEFPKGVAAIKAEYLLEGSTSVGESFDDDDVEASRTDRQGGPNDQKKKKKRRGQNKKRQMHQEKEEIKLCPKVLDPENPNASCPFGPENCRFSHDVDAYLAQKEPDLPGECPVWAEFGYCPTGFKCRWLKSHYDPETKTLTYKEGYSRKPQNGELNWTTGQEKNMLRKKQIDLSNSDKISDWIDQEYKGKNREEIEAQDKANSYVEPPFKPAEKKRLHYKGAKIVAPLTTVGNLPYRRLMKTLGADVTYSEMALTLPLIQGSKSEWALIKAHESEYPGFGVQLATAKSWQGGKAVEAICKLAPQVSEFNLNCGCPIDMLFRKGEGSALLENPNRLLRILKCMNYSSSEAPVTVKIRMGIKDDKPLAQQLVPKILEEGDAAAIVLHGRSRKQRYTKENNWDYIGEIGKIVKDWNESQEDEAKDKPEKRPVFLIGNGDCYSHEDWYSAIERPGVDSVMVGRGALIKPWIFEEIEQQQYLDKSAVERLAMIEQYSKFALDHWGSDEFGVNTARRYVCEFLSFTHRYIPVGILERLPPKLNQRPPPWKGRNELETLLGSPDYKDWIKISEMFLGPAGDGFNFVPKHKSNSFEKTD